MDGSAAVVGDRVPELAFVPEHVGINVRDLEASVAFFRDALGYAVDEILTALRREIADITAVPDASCDLTLLRPPQGGPRLELIQYTAGQGSGGPDPSLAGLAVGHVAYVVPSVADALTHLERHGARRVASVVDYPDGPAVYCREPGGAVVELMEVRTGT